MDRSPTQPRMPLEIIPVGDISAALLKRIGGEVDAVLGTAHSVGAPLELGSGDAASGAADRADLVAESADALLDTVVARRAADPGDGWLLAVSGGGLRAPGGGRVFGAAAVGAGCAVVGLAPLDAATSTGATASLARAVKVCVHEIGHAAGLEHCADRGCVMHPSRDIADVDRKDKLFCRRCAKDLYHATLDVARG